MTSMKNVLMKHKILILCICTHICIFIAAYFGWLDIFFSGAALHMPNKLIQGIDFYQVPRGAWAFWHGGSFTGAPVQGKVYAPGQAVNLNVYHPLFTITLGSLFMQFDPHSAYYIWFWAKLPLSLATVVYFYWSFRDHKYVQFATCILLVNMSMYLELVAGQYQLLLNLFILLFLTTLIKNRSFLWTGLLYGLGLLVKPIGLLFLPALIIKRRWKMAIFTVFIFLCTLGLFIDDPYYINNLFVNIAHPNIADIQIITLNELLRSFHWPDLLCKFIQYTVLVFILALISFRRIHISKAIFLMIAYFLCFYTLVYEYDFSILPYVIAPCLMCCASFHTRFSKLCIVFTCLPGCIVVFNLLHIGVKDGVPGTRLWQLMVVSKLLPLFLLCGSVLWSDMKPIVQQAKIFLATVKKLNDHLKVFG